MIRVVMILTLLCVLLMALAVFMRADPKFLARMIWRFGPLSIGVIGALMTLIGQAAIGGIFFAGSAAAYGIARKMRDEPQATGARTIVRTAALEMELDFDTDALEGHVLAGTYEGRPLSTLGFAELEAMLSEFARDNDSVRLLETYLDRRFPAWRDRVDPHRDAGLGNAPGTGAMSKEEAYQILGLEPGASAPAIRKAHRRLMQRLHPDLGGTTFLAARINEAKDVLLSYHD